MTIYPNLFIPFPWDFILLYFPLKPLVYFGHDWKAQRSSSCILGALTLTRPIRATSVTCQQAVAQILICAFIWGWWCLFFNTEAPGLVISKSYGRVMPPPSLFLRSNERKPGGPPFRTSMKWRRPPTRHFRKGIITRFTHEQLPLYNRLVVKIGFGQQPVKGWPQVSALLYNASNIQSARN